MQGNWRVRFGGAGLALAAVLVSGWMSSASAQDLKIRKTALNKEDRNQILEDLGNTRDFGRIERNKGRPRATGLSAPTAEMKKIRPLIEEFAKEISLLNTQLHDDQSQNPSLRSLLSDTYKVTADSVLLAKDTRIMNDHIMLLDDLRRIDAAWGELSYRLGTVRRLSDEAKDHVDALNEIAVEVRQSLDIGQQVNYRDLSNKTVTMATDLEHLLEDIKTQLSRTQEGKKLYAATSKAHQQVLAMADLSDDRADLPSISREYERFRELWYPQAAVLQDKDREFEQSLRRITRTDGEIARLLLIEQKFDKTQIVYLTSALRKEIDVFSNTLPLKELLQLPKANQALASADEFFGVCENFIDTVNTQEDIDHIIDAFRDIEQADRNFLKVFGEIEDEDAALSLEKITQNLNALRAAIQVDREDFNRPAAISLAAKIENLTDNIDVTARRWLAHDRPSFAAECLDETDALARSAQKLHDEIINGSNVVQIRRDTEELYQNWRTVYNFLVKCQTDERPTLGRMSSQLTPALVELRTLVAQ